MFKELKQTSFSTDNWEKNYIGSIVSIKGIINNEKANNAGNAANLYNNLEKPP